MNGNWTDSPTAAREFEDLYGGAPDLRGLYELDNLGMVYGGMPDMSGLYELEDISATYDIRPDRRYL
ncbi:hypothetical protein [Ralstonia chuxiongensis]|uniref:hypothetical protein n=1 Tax=Ralstonia chuxiongensis TaxID=2957504 RepID=UPI0028F5900F|nr:hypothetical protein [Ralstonia chuxiongensis]CAJ0777694.1 hypothetical protein R8510_04398 [Ralstonia chuxiongensis]